jgi:hypothetical protein
VASASSTDSSSSTTTASATASSTTTASASDTNLAALLQEILQAARAYSNSSFDPSSVTASSLETIA